MTSTVNVNVPDVSACDFLRTTHSEGPRWADPLKTLLPHQPPPQPLPVDFVTPPEQYKKILTFSRKPISSGEETSSAAASTLNEVLLFHFGDRLVGSESGFLMPRFFTHVSIMMLLNCLVMHYPINQPQADNEDEAATPKPTKQVPNEWESYMEDGLSWMREVGTRR